MRPGRLAAYVLVAYIAVFLLGGLVPIAGGLARLVASWSYATRLVATLALLSALATILLPLFDKPGAGAAATLFFVLLFVGAVAASWHRTVTGAELWASAEWLDEPIPVEMARIVPLETAHAYAASMLQRPTHYVNYEHSYVYYTLNGSAVYGFVVEPEGVVNSYTQPGGGIVVVGGSEYPPRVNFTGTAIKWVPGKYELKPYTVAKSLWWIIKAKHPSLSPVMENSIPLIVDGGPVLVVPLKTWRVGARTSLPVLWGFAVAYGDKVELVPASKIAGHPVLSRAFEDYRIPLVPEAIAREWVEKMRWHPGFWQVVFKHNTFEVRDIGTNPQPYLVYDSAGHLYWLFIAEPSGASYSVKYLIYVDAESPEPRILIYEPRENLIGISKVETYIKKAHPTFDWGEFKLAEPIPIVTNETLLWKVTIITQDARGVVAIDLVDAKTGNVASIPVGERLTKEQFYTMLRGQAVSPAPGKPPTTEEELIRRIRERIDELQRQLDELKKLLDELEAVRTNQTSP